MGDKTVQFLFGGLAGMGATCVVQPIDLIKTRMQLSGEGGAARVHKTSLHAAINIVRTEGFRNMYRGLTAGLLRQATYTTTRMGVYTSMLDYMKSEDGKPPNIWKKGFAGVVGGGIGAIVGTPAEVALIRMTSDGRLPPEQRRGYTNVVNALSRIAKEEGVITMWRGCGPTVARAMVLNMVQLGSYSQIKELLLSTKYFHDNVGCHLAASVASGFLATCVSMPIDIAKTRVQTMKVIDGVPEYKGGLDVITKTIKNEGLFALWKGFTPYFMRLGPHTIITFLILEQMNHYYTKVTGKKAGTL